MTNTAIVVLQYDADEGKVFDWKDEHKTSYYDENDILIETVEHLYAKTLFIGEGDSIDNYVEIDETTI